MAVCAFAGLWLGEAAGLQVGDVDFLRRTLRVARQVQGQTVATTTVVPPKAGSERAVYVPAALTARRYCAPVDVVLDVVDARLPANAGRWRLVTGRQGPDGAWDAQVTPTNAPADLTADVRELGAAYLGGRSLAAQVRAGLVTEHRTGAVQAASGAFGWPVAPVCSWIF